MNDIVDQRYRIEEKLAVGGFGTIYRATETTIGRQVALKILHRELAGDATVVARFRREAAALAKLKSPHTLTLYDVGEHDDTLYFVMELLRGESLLEVFTHTGPLPWRRIAHIARGVCASLREAHALGIVHRDLKPANIFLERHADDADYVKVLDFGIAKAVASDALDNRDLTRHGQMIGTFDYMSPEQMVGAPCTSKTDLFTLGVVMYEMLAGSRPFGMAHVPAQMLMALMTHVPTPLTGVPSELARIVMKCLAREPHERPDIEQLDMVLANVLGVDEAAFSDLDEPTVVAALPPRPARRQAFLLQPRAASQASAMAGSVSVASTPHEETRMIRGALAVAPTMDVRASTAPTIRARGSDVAIQRIEARGSQAEIERDIDLALAETAIALEPSHELPIEPPRKRIASGTSPIENVPAESTTDEHARANFAIQLRVVTLPPAPQSAALSFLRVLTIALCLFGLGFLGALAIWSSL